jgi:UDP-N-acetylglucosamine 2-epimerase (non-hydrolysing)
MSQPLKLLLIAGARPNFMKVAPLIHAIQHHNGSGRSPEIHYKLVHTGQHYDEKMSGVFFRELNIPAPDINLEVGSGSHALQTAHIMERFEPVLLTAFSNPTAEVHGPVSVVRCPSSVLPPASSAPQSAIGNPQSAIPTPLPTAAPPHRPPSSGLPDWLVVFGDVNSTLACTLVAAKLGVKVAHVEAGLRSFDRTMPEEINRLVTDSIADLLLTPSEDADRNLRREGVAEEKIRLVGNIMIDSLVANLEKARQSTILKQLHLKPEQFVYVTLHRPSNVDHISDLRPIMAELQRLAQRLPVVFPLHPRTRKMLADFGITLGQGSEQPRSSVLGPPSSVSGSTLLLLDPLGYHDSLCLTEHARFVLTDSGGLQEESTFFRTPCLTLRPNTERPVSITHGSNRLTSLLKLPADLQLVLSGPLRLGNQPPFWDGSTAVRVLEALRDCQKT